MSFLYFTFYRWLILNGRNLWDSRSMEKQRIFLVLVLKLYSYYLNKRHPLSALKLTFCSPFFKRRRWEESDGLWGRVLSREHTLCSALRLRWPGPQRSSISNHECPWSAAIRSAHMRVAAYESKRNTEAGSTSPMSTFLKTLLVIRSSEFILKYHTHRTFRTAQLETPKDFRILPFSFWKVFEWI